VKRIVGLPGEQIQMRDGSLFINGQLVARRRIEPGETIRASVVPTYEETLPGGARYRIVKLQGDRGGSLDNTEVYTIPPQAYFRIWGQSRQFGGFAPSH